jgi:hypothetical protein
MLAFLAWLWNLITGRDQQATSDQALGRSEQAQADATVAAQAEARIAASEAQGPRNIDEAIQRAKDGTI